VAEQYQLLWLETRTTSGAPSWARVRVLERNHEAPAEAEGHGDGPIDAALNAVVDALHVDARLVAFSVEALSSGPDALAEAHVTVEVGRPPPGAEGVAASITEAGRACVPARAVRRRAGRSGRPRLTAVPISPYLRDLRATIGPALIVLPSVGAVVRGEDGRVLLVHDASTGAWVLPGGAVDPDEGAGGRAGPRGLGGDRPPRRALAVLGVYGGPVAAGALRQRRPRQLRPDGVHLRGTVGDAATRRRRDPRRLLDLARDASDAAPVPGGSTRSWPTR
jgi:hypothetical protein